MNETYTYQYSLWFVVAVAIFFANELLGIPLALLFSPLFFVAILKPRQLSALFVGLLVLFGFGLVHVPNINHPKSFIISNVLLIAILIAGILFLTISKEQRLKNQHFYTLANINFGFSLIAIISLFIPSLKTILWYNIPFTANYSVIPRLKLFASEASHYSLTITPLFFFFLWRSFQQWRPKDLCYLAMTSLSLLLSFSLGIWAAIFISLCFVLILFLPYWLLQKHQYNIILILAGLGFLSLITLWLLFPDNPLFFRLKNIWMGADTSGRGRTYEAFDIAWQLLKQEHSQWWGLGLGQFKHSGRLFLIDYYQYMNIPNTVRLPNAMAELLVTFGIVGFVLKLVLECFLFFYTKVYKDIFRLSLFLFLFIYQFTGSYLSNYFEYFYWILAFTPLFPLFQTKNYWPNE